MITSAAVKILDIIKDEEKIIPCHRHCDVFYILYLFNMKKDIDYKVIEEGFLDENDNFYSRLKAKEHAIKCNQIINTEYNELYSEDLW